MKSMISPPGLLAQAEIAAARSDWPTVMAHLSKQSGALEDSRWLDLAQHVLENGDFQLRWNVAKLLPQFGRSALDRLLTILADDEADPEVHWFALRALTDPPDPTTITTLLQVIQQSDAGLVPIAIHALAQMGATVLPAIVPLLDQQDSRFAATQILAQMHHRGGVEYLLPLVEDSDPAVRQVAIDALGRFHSPDIAAVLLKALEDPIPMVRLATITAVRFCWKDDPALDWVGAIAPLLNDPDVAVGIQAAIALGYVSRVEAIPSLMQALRSAALTDQQAIAFVRSLLILDWPQAITLWDRLTIAPRMELIRHLGQLQTGQESLVTWLEQDPIVAESPALRQELVRAIGQQGTIMGLEPLINQLAHPDQRDRLHVIAALKQLATIMPATSVRQQLQDWPRNHPVNEALGQGITIALQEWSSCV
jgi:HEAT repeat protein